MGTSGSYGGPSDSSPLLPTWSLPSAEPGGDSADGDEATSDTFDSDSAGAADDGLPGEPGSSSSSSGSTDPAAQAPASADPPPETSQATPVAMAAPSSGWRAAKSSMTRYASSGGGRRGISRAGRSYVRAKGGSRSAATSARSGRVATARLGGFLSGVASGGLATGLAAVGLQDLVGQDVDHVLAGLANALAPSGASLEEAAARMAINEVLEALYEEHIAEDGLAGLDSLTSEQVGEAITQGVEAYVYHRWLQELGNSIEKGAVSVASATGMENEMRVYVREMVQLELGAKDPVAINWSGAEGQEVVQRLYEDAYAILENVE